MVSIVSGRFVLVVHEMKKKGLIKSFRQFASDIEYFPQGMSAILNGEREVSVELIRKTALLYPINLDFIFIGQGEAFIIKTDQYAELERQLLKVPYFMPKQINLLEEYYRNGSRYVVDSIQVPSGWFSDKEIMAFHIVKDMMSPALHSGDFVFCSEVESSQLRSGNIYGVLANNDMVFYRYKNPDDDTFLIFTQDAVPDSEVRIDRDEVLRFFEVERKVTAVLHVHNAKLNTQISRELQQIKFSSEEQLESMKNLNKSMETLLKQIRLGK